MAGWLVVAVIISDSLLGVVNSQFQAYIPFFNRSEEEYSHRYNWGPGETVLSRPPRQRPPTINLLALGDADGWEVEKPQYQPGRPSSAPSTSNAPPDQRWNPYERSPFSTAGQQPWNHWDAGLDNHGRHNPPRSASLVYEQDRPSIPLRPEYRPQAQHATTPAPHIPEYQLDYPHADSDYDDYSELIDYLDLEDLKNEYDVSMEDILKIVEEIEEDYDLSLLEKSTQKSDYEDHGHYDDEPHNYKWDDYDQKDQILNHPEVYNTELPRRDEGNKGQVWEISEKKQPLRKTPEKLRPHDHIYNLQSSGKTLDSNYADVSTQHVPKSQRPSNGVQEDGRHRSRNDEQQQNIQYQDKTPFKLPQEPLYRGHVELQTESLTRDSLIASRNSLKQKQTSHTIEKEQKNQSLSIAPTTTVRNSDTKLPRTRKSHSHKIQDKHNLQLTTEMIDEENVSTEMLQDDEELSTILSDKDLDFFAEKKHELELDVRVKQIPNTITEAPKSVEKNTLLSQDEAHAVITHTPKEVDTEEVSTHNANLKDLVDITENSSLVKDESKVFLPKQQPTTSNPEPTLSTPELTKLRNRNDYIPPLHKLFSNVDTVTRRTKLSQGNNRGADTLTRRPFHTRTTHLPRLEDLFLRATHRSRPLTKDKEAIVWLDTTTQAYPPTSTTKRAKVIENTIKDEEHPKTPDAPSKDLSSHQNNEQQRSKQPTSTTRRTTTSEKPQDFANAISGLDFANLDEAELLKLVNQYTEPEAAVDTGIDETDDENQKTHKDKPVITKLPKQLEDPFMTLTPKYDREFQTQMAREMDKVAKASSVSHNKKIPYIEDEIDDPAEDEQNNPLHTDSVNKNAEPSSEVGLGGDEEEPDLDSMMSEFDEGNLSVEDIYKLVEQYTNPHLTPDNVHPSQPKDAPSPRPKPTRRTFGNKGRNKAERPVPVQHRNPGNKPTSGRPKNIQRSRLPQTNFSRRKRPESIAELLNEGKVETLDISEITKLVNKYTQPNGTNSTSQFQNGTTENDDVLKINGIIFPKSANGRPSEKPNPWLRPPMVGVAILGEGEEGAEESKLDLAERLKPEISIPDDKLSGNVHRHPIPSTIRKASPYGPDFGHGVAVLSEYGHHSGRPVITSRLTTTSTTEPTLEAPFDNPELRRPGLYGSGSGLGNLDEGFLDEEEIDIVYDYEEVEDNTKSAIIASSVLGGLAVLFFIILLLVCRWRQKAWRSLSKHRIPDSNSSLPTVSPKANRKGQNSQSGLWTLLRKSKRNIDRSNSLNSSDDPS